MALSTRELYLVLRARDEASRVLRGVSGSIRGLDAQVAAAAQRNIAHGQALVTMGIGIAGAAAVGLAGLNSMTDAAIEYNNAAAKTMTQTDGIKTSVKELADLGREVAKTIPAPFEQLQETLYDIFSSMDVNVPQADKLLHQFAKDAVGGATDVGTAGRSVIQILNAYKVPVKEVSKISDVMFQLVRKGVGTYQQFANTIGRAVPSAVRSGQSIQTLAGMLAFLTRNGLSAAMASTSAARALDALSNPRAAKNLAELGVKVTDAKGKFRPLVDIIEDMNKKTKNMSQKQRTQWLTDAFKGAGGTIQAMRFFNLALSDTNGLLPKMVDNMKKSKGAAKDAYDIMSKTPAAQIQLLKNKYAALQTEVGDKLIPIKLKLVEILSKLLDAWDKLSPRMQGIIVKGALIAAALGIIIGVVTTVAGVMLMLAGAATIAGVGLVGFITPIAIVVAAIVALIAIVVLVIKHWQAIKPVLQNVGNAIKDFAVNAWGAIVAGALWVWDMLKKVGAYLWGVFGPTLIAAWESIKKSAVDLWNNLKTAFQDAWKILKPAFGDLMTTLKQLWGIFGGVLGAIWTLIKPFVGLVLGLLVISLINGIKMLAAVFAFLASFIGAVLPPVIRLIATVIGAIITIIKDFVGLVYSLMKGDWSKAWEYAKKFLKDTLSAAVRILAGLAESILSIITGLVRGVINFFKSLYDQLVGHSIIPDMVRAIIKWFTDLWTNLVATAKKIWQDVVQKFKDGWTALKTVVSNGVTWIKDKFAKASEWLVNAGRDIIGGLKSGISDAVKGISSWIKDSIVDPIVSAVKRWFGIHSPSTVFFGLGVNLLKGLIGGLASTNAGSIVKNIFGSMPNALAGLLDKGMIDFANLPSKALNALIGLGGKASSSVKKALAYIVETVQGKKIDLYTLTMLRKAQKSLGKAFSIAQGSFSTSVAASAGTHAGGGVIDIGSPTTPAALAALIRAGFAAWIRTPAQGPWMRHIHAIAMGDPRMAKAAAAQVASFLRGGSGLASGFAKGGWIREPIWGIGRSGKTYTFGENEQELVVPGHQVGKGGGTNQQITIYTNEIDPRRHAAELGWMLANRVA